MDCGQALQQPQVAGNGSFRQAARNTFLPRNHHSWPPPTQLPPVLRAERRTALCFCKVRGEFVIGERVLGLPQTLGYACLQLYKSDMRSLHLCKQGSPLSTCTLLERQGLGKGVGVESSFQEKSPGKGAQALERCGGGYLMTQGKEEQVTSEKLKLQKGVSLERPLDGRP